MRHERNPWNLIIRERTRGERDIGRRDVQTSRYDRGFTDDLETEISVAYARVHGNPQISSIEIEATDGEWRTTLLTIRKKK